MEILVHFSTWVSLVWGMNPKWRRWLMLFLTVEERSETGANVANDASDVNDKNDVNDVNNANDFSPECKYSFV